MPMACRARATPQKQPRDTNSRACTKDERSASSRPRRSRRPLVASAESHFSTLSPSSRKSSWPAGGAFPGGCSSNGCVRAPGVTGGYTACIVTGTTGAADPCAGPPTAITFGVMPPGAPVATGVPARFLTGERGCQWCCSGGGAARCMTFGDGGTFGDALPRCPEPRCPEPSGPTTGIKALGPTPCLGGTDRDPDCCQSCGCS
mmetsp:Transcript_40638/g.130815  ORF Transcript_40638/g.130815 Transcript_40638/m.130815 type:complete len:203 (-) Transcript_40638:154-762(-)